MFPLLLVDPGCPRCVHVTVIIEHHPILICRFTWKTLDWGEKSGELYRYKEIFFGAKILAMIRHIYFQSCGCGAHFYSSVPPKRNNLTTLYNILQHLQHSTTYIQHLQHFTTFYNITHGDVWCPPKVFR